MDYIPLQRIIDRHGLDKLKVAAELWPTNSFQGMAIKRVLKGETELDAGQIVRLAEYIGCPVQELFSHSEWKLKSKDNLLTFHSDKYRAVLDRDTWLTTVFSKDSLLVETAIHSTNTTISEYLLTLEGIINQHEKHGK